MGTLGRGYGDAGLTGPPSPALLSARRFSLSDLTSGLSSSVAGFTGLFDQVPADSGYVFETRFNYTDLGAYYGSDYFISQVGAPEGVDRKFGDAFFDTRLIRDAVMDATGERFLDKSITSDSQQMKWLVDNAASEEDRLHLAPGVALTAAQAKALDKDIVCYETDLIDGVPTLVPRLYLAGGDTQFTGAVISGNGVSLADDTIVNDKGAITGFSFCPQAPGGAPPRPWADAP